MRTGKQSQKVSVADEGEEAVLLRLLDAPAVARVKMAQLAGVGPDAVDAMHERREITLHTNNVGAKHGSLRDTAKVVLHYSKPRR